MCERKGAGFIQPSMDHDGKTYAAFPADRQVNIGGRRLKPESCNDRDVRCAAIYESKRPIRSRFWPC
jgi:hypothetical protein